MKYNCVDADVSQNNYNEKKKKSNQKKKGIYFMILWKILENAN